MNLLPFPFPNITFPEGQFEKILQKHQQWKENIISIAEKELPDEQYRPQPISTK